MQGVIAPPNRTDREPSHSGSNGAIVPDLNALAEPNSARTLRSPTAEENKRELENNFTIRRLLQPHWKGFLIGLLAVGAETIAGLLEPWPLKVVFDNVLRAKKAPDWLSGVVVAIAGEDSIAILRFAALAVILIAVIGAIGTYVEKRTITEVGQRVMHELRRTFYWHIQRLSMAYHDHKRSGDVISTISTDIDAIQSAITAGVLDALYYSLTLLGMIAVMFYLDWRFTLIALSVLPALLLVVYTFTRRIKKASREVRKKEAEIISTLQEVLSSIRLVKAFTREEYEQRKFEAESTESVDLALKARSIKAKLAPAVEMIVACGTALVLWFGARQAMEGALTPGTLIVFFLYLGKMYKPMRELSKMSDTYSKAIVGYDRIKEFLHIDLNVRDLPDARPAPGFRGEIEFEGVSFGYAPERPVLKNINLKIEAGKVAALVGLTGSGKSTLISLIPRFYDPLSGSIKIDGVDVRKFKRKTVRQQISFVLQETLLFRAPIWQNIAYGRPEASHAEIRQAAKLANADEFIQGLPQGYDTMVGERGATLSGGQRQCIAIARAIIRDSPILILDEPSTGLDAASEKLVLDGLSHLMENRTTIVVAHRLATVQRADVIFVLQDGAIAESGSHEQLLANGGLYAQFHFLQSKNNQENREGVDPPVGGTSCEAA
ncbi:MAG TPA: ABC transporter ATP-binding protein [Bryobacteraceae bacterium]|nr:ABC transporter ATP-binding protein [Bryobacteraceae bacterium]